MTQIRELTYKAVPDGTEKVAIQETDTTTKYTSIQAMIDALGITGATGAAGADGSITRYGSGVPANGLGADNDVYIDIANSGLVYYRAGGVYSSTGYSTTGATGATGATGPEGPTATGSVIGPASATDNAIVRYDGITGELVQDSAVIVDDTNNVSGVGNITLTGTVDGRDVATDGSKLDGIEALADVTDVTNVTAAGALMDSELASITDVKALNQSVVSGATPTFTTTNFTDATNKRFMSDAQESKLDAIEALADVTDVTNVTAAGALMDSELTDLAGVKGVTISTLQVKPVEGAFADGDKTKLDGIEALADVTDATNVNAAGAVMNSDFTVKGQIGVATGSGTITTLTVGANDTVLTADSAEASGVKWAASGGGGGGYSYFSADLFTG